MRFLIHHDGAEFGPLSLEEVREAVAAGALRPDDLAWQEGSPDWLPLCHIPGATLGLLPASAADREQTSGLAIASLVLGLLSLGGCMLFTGIPGVIFGHLALSQIRGTNGRLKGEGLAIGGLVTSYIGVVLTTLILAGSGYVLYLAAQGGKNSTQAMNQGVEIARACRTYASDHGGKFPSELEVLVPDYVQDDHSLSDPGQREGAEIGYYYYGSGHFQTEDRSQILLASKARYGKKRVVVRFDGRSRLEVFTPRLE